MIDKIKEAVSSAKLIISELEEEVKSLEKSMMGDEYYIEGLEGKLADKDAEIDRLKGAALDIKTIGKIHPTIWHEAINRAEYVYKDHEVIAYIYAEVQCMLEIYHKAQQDKLGEVNG